jgi:(p)ppGpp synthase/HD superfamily hydrolase
MTSPSPFEAMMFAREAHKHQMRKYTNEPYIIHLAEVAGIVASVVDIYPPRLRDVMISASWLHDSREDQGITEDELVRHFGLEVASGVAWLSDLETEGNRAARKAAGCERLAKAPGWVQTIKCADLISNTASIVKYDPKFAVVYLAEKRALLHVMRSAHPGLWDLASQQAHVALPELAAH